MKLKLVKYSKYKFPFKKPFITSSNKFDYREGFILQIENESGNIGFGEAAPLEGFGIETLRDAEESIQRLNEIFFYDANTFNSLGELNQKLIDNKISNPVISAVTFAYFQIIMRENKSRELFLTKYPFSKNIILNAVISIKDFESTIEEINLLQQKGFSTIKLKIGKDHFNDDLEILNHIKRNFPNLKLRLDVNGSWTFEETLANLNKLNDFNIEYIEEPTRGLNSLIELSRIFTNVNIAIDESIRNFEDAYKILNESNIQYLIIKPSLFGGMQNVLLLNEAAISKNKKLIISSAFESSLGRYQNAIIAAFLNNDLAHGIDTSNNLSEDLCENFYKVEKNKLAIDLDLFPENILSKL